jgi:tripartite-type tricarboxylate transporter receptor subunit TctC
MTEIGMFTRRKILAASAALAAAGFSRRARAQTVKKPVRIIVGFPAGGGTDIASRILAERLRGSYSSTLLVENRPGAGSRLAAEHVKNAEPDGSTIMAAPEFVFTPYPSVFKSLNYDPVGDFAHVSPVYRSMLCFNVGPAVPESVKTLSDFVQWCKANPAKASFATTSAGGTPHFIGVMLANEAKTAINAVHYRGGAPALQDLVGGHIAASVNPISESVSQAKGALRILAVTGSKRSPFLPDVPTMRESGYNVVLDTWFGIFAPAKTPPDVVQALNAQLLELSRSKEMADQWAKIGSEPHHQTPAQLTETVKADIQRWAAVVKASGFVALE